MQNQAIDENNEVNEYIIDELEDMDDEYDSAQRLLRMQNKAVDENDEVHEDIIDELEDIDDEYDRL